MVEAEFSTEASVLITRFLESSLPFRTLFMNPGLERYRERLVQQLGQAQREVYRRMEMLLGQTFD